MSRGARCCQPHLLTSGALRGHPRPFPCGQTDGRTFERALQLLAPAVEVAAGAEEAADGGGHHGHEEDHGRGDARYGLGTWTKNRSPHLPASRGESSPHRPPCWLGPPGQRDAGLCPPRWGELGDCASPKAGQPPEQRPPCRGCCVHPSPGLNSLDSQHRRPDGQSSFLKPRSVTASPYMFCMSASPPPKTSLKAPFVRPPLMRRKQ